MRIAILHYHLHAGGVGRIIDLAAKVLTEAGHHVAVIAGSPPHPRSLLDRRRVGVVSDLNYTTLPGDVQGLGKQVDAAARGILGCAPDLWHIHNPTLGKNPMVPMLAARWAGEGRALVLQLHDFAEQERPANYRVLLEAAESVGMRLQEFLYPMNSRVRYAVLTAHVATLLDAAGLESGAFVLPNPVQQLPMEAPFPASAIHAEEYLVYPTRAIERKNLGEALLWSALMRPGQKLVITMAPEDPVSRREHEAWERFAVRHDLPVIFDSVRRFGRPLGDFISGSRAAITTSIREGFGMAYLEPWLLGVPVVGRDLSTVTADFRAEGLSFDWLYPSIPVELTTEENDIRIQMSTAFRAEKVRAYGVSPREGELDRRIEVCADFGYLPSLIQRSVLERGIRDEFSGCSLPDLKIKVAGSQISSTERILERNFGLEGYLRRLERIYESALLGQEEGSTKKANNDFLNPEDILVQLMTGS